jgi:hypothetical protein
MCPTTRSNLPLPPCPAPGVHFKLLSFLERYPPNCRTSRSDGRRSRAAPVGERSEQTLDGATAQSYSHYQLVLT